MPLHLSLCSAIACCVMCSGPYGPLAGAFTRSSLLTMKSSRYFCVLPCTARHGCACCVLAAYPWFCLSTSWAPRIQSRPCHPGPRQGKAKGWIVSVAAEIQHCTSIRGSEPVPSGSRSDKGQCQDNAKAMEFAGPQYHHPCSHTPADRLWYLLLYLRHSLPRPWSPACPPHSRNLNRLPG
jgi:hypothetical protein